MQQKSPWATQVLVLNVYLEDFYKFVNYVESNFGYLNKILIVIISMTLWVEGNFLWFSEETNFFFDENFENVSFKKFVFGFGHMIEKTVPWYHQYWGCSLEMRSNDIRMTA